MGYLDDITGMFTDKPRTTYDPAQANARLDKLAAALNVKPEDVEPYKALMQFSNDSYGDVRKQVEDSGPSKIGTIIGAPMASIGTFLATGGRQSGIEQAQGMVDKFYGHKDTINGLLKANADNAMKYGEMMVETGMKRRDQQRLLDVMKPGGGAGASAQPIHPAGTLPTVASGVERAPLPDIPGTTVVPPEGNSGAAPAQPQPPPLPQQGGQGPRVNKYQIDETQLRPLPYSDEQIAQASVLNDKAADNMRQMNDQVIKENEQRIKLAEVQKSAAANDPGLAAEIEKAKLGAKGDNDRLQLQKTTQIQAEGLNNMLAELEALPDKLKAQGEDFDSMTGAFDTWNPMGMRDMLGNETSNRVREKIAGDMQTIAVTMKKFVRGPGEGSWSDADQLGLERSVGNLQNARNTKDYKFRLNDVRTRISKAFTEPMGVELDQLGQDGAVQSQGGAAQQGKSTAVAPEQQQGIAQRFATADPAGKQAILDSLKKRGIDPSFLAPSASGNQSPATSGPDGYMQ